MRAERGNFQDLINLSARITKNTSKRIGVQTTPLTSDIAKQIFARWSYRYTGYRCNV
jgi:hypothetical protein